MYFLFIDESGNPALTGSDASKPFVLSGVALPDGIWHEVSEGLKRLKAEFAVAGELKWRHFGRRGGDTPLAHLSLERRDDLRRRFYDLIFTRKAVRVMAVVGHPAEYAITGSFANQEHGLYRACLKTLSERFQYFLQDQEREVGAKQTGLLVCDHSGADHDRKMRAAVASLMRGSTPWTSTYRNVMETLFFADSELSVGIQIADMAAGAIWRKYASGDDRWFKLIEPRIRRSPDGRIEGYGIAREPHK